MTEVNYDVVYANFMELAEVATQHKDFSKNHRAQADLLFKIACHYPEFSSAQRQGLRAKLCPVVPRMANANSPQDVFEAVMDLARFPTGFEEISRALRVNTVKVPDFEADHGEDIYPKTGWIGDYMRWVRDAEIPLGYHFWSAVSLIGAACRYKFFIDRQSYFLRLNTYIVFVGDKATGKSAAKDAALNVANKCNFLVQPNLNEKHRHLIRVLPEDTNQETLVKLLKADEDTIESDLEGAPPKNVLVDSTGYLVLDELSTFLGKDVWALAKRVPFLTTLYGREIYDYETKSGGHIKLRNTALSMLACSAPEWMKESITPLMFGGGFMDRTLFIYRRHVARSYPTPAPLDPISAVRLSYFIKYLTSRDELCEMLPTEETVEFYDNWYNKQPKTSDLTGMSTKRKANHAWKLAAVLSLSDGSAPWIHINHMRDSIMYLDHEELQFEMFMDEVQRAPEADLILHILKVLRRHGGTMKHNDLFNALHNKKMLSPPATKVPPFLKSMEEMGLIDVAQKGRGRVYKLTREGREHGYS